MPVTTKGTHYQVWYDQPRYNDHVWAFIGYCRNQGDRVHVRYKTALSTFL